MICIEIERVSSNNFVSNHASFEMVKPSSKIMKNKGVSVGRACFPSNAQINSIQLINFSDQDQWINKGVKLGEVISVEIPEQNDLSDALEELDFESTINKELPLDDRQAIKELLTKYSSCFSSTNSTLGSSNIVQHRIDIVIGYR